MLSWEASIPSIVDQVEEEQDPWEENLDFEEDDEYESDDDDEDDDDLEDEYEEYEEEFGQDDEPRHGRRPAEWD